MSATVQQFIITDDQMASAGAGSYADLEVPQDYTAVLETIEDYDKTKDGKGKGWKARFRIEGLPFDYWVAHSDAARWKLIEFVHAFEPGFFDVREADGTTRPVNVNKYVGMTVGAHVILDETMDIPRKTVDYVFSLAEDEPEPADVPAL